MKILSSAQSFGYGPASKLVTLAKWLRPHKDYHIDFLGDDVALTYVLQNSLYFNNIYEYSGEYPDDTDYDLVVSVMNPYTVIWAWINNIKSIYVDSLFWFWNWDESKYEYLENVISQLRSANNISEAWALVKEVDPHDMQYIAYKLTELALVQKFSFENDNNKTDIYRDNLKVSVIGPIIDNGKRKNNKERNKIIISLSGLLSPLNREKEALRYSDLVMNLLDELLGDLPEDIEVFLTTNPNVITDIRPINERINLVSLSNNAFLEMLNETILLFAPAGITTLYESLTYNVPIFFLPEQHDGHYKNYLKLISGADNKTFPELMFNTRVKRSEEKDPDEEILAIQGLIKRGAQNLNDSILQDMKKDAKKALNYISDDNKRLELLDKQQLLLNLNSESEINIVEQIDIVINGNMAKTPRKRRIGIISDSINPVDITDRLTSIAQSCGDHDMNVFSLSDKNISDLCQLSHDNGSKIFAISQLQNLHEYKERFPTENEELYDKIYFLNTDMNKTILHFVEMIDELIVLSVNNRNIFAMLAAIELGKPVFCSKDLKNKLGFISSQLLDLENFQNSIHKF